MRTIIDLTEEQIRKLSDYTESEGISRAEAVRRAIDHYLAESAAERRKRAFEASFGAWGTRDLDSREFVEEIRGESDDRARQLGY